MNAFIIILWSEACKKISFGRELVETGMNKKHKY